MTILKNLGSFYIKWSRSSCSILLNAHSFVQNFNSRNDMIEQQGLLCGGQLCSINNFQSLKYDCCITIMPSILNLCTENWTSLQNPKILLSKIIRSLFKFDQCLKVNISVFDNLNLIFSAIIRKSSF